MCVVPNRIDVPNCEACGSGFAPGETILRGENGELWQVGCLPVNFARCACCGYYCEVSSLKADWLGYKRCERCSDPDLEPSDPPGWEGGFAENH